MRCGTPWPPSPLPQTVIDAKRVDRISASPSTKENHVQALGAYMTRVIQIGETRDIWDSETQYFEPRECWFYLLYDMLNDSGFLF